MGNSAVQVMRRDLSVRAAPANRTNVLATAGFVLYCVYLLSGYANDWSMMLFGSKAYLSTFTLVMLPVVWLLSGTAASGLRHGVGWWWVAFLLWLLLATPFSVWKGGSARMLLNYVPKSYLCFFYTCSFVTSLRRCRCLMYVNAAGAGLLLLTCLNFGDAGADLAGERLRIPGSLFYANANDLALTLLFGMTAFLFLLFSEGILAKIIGSMGIMLSTLYALKTGSRGCLVAGIALFGMILLSSRNKFKVVSFALPILGLALFSLPRSTLHRLSLLLAAPETAMSESTSDEASLASEFQRQGLLKKSLDYTLAHPLLGVGPDQFATAVFGEASKEGEHVPWLGTHNTYTQVASECGIPALIFYCGPILLCFRLNYRLYRRTRDQTANREIAGLSLCLLAATLVYALSAFFFHIAYSAILPGLAGFSVALHFASRSLLDGSSTPQQRWSDETAAEESFPGMGTP
jgi:O-antigen ligase